MEKQRSTDTLARARVAEQKLRQAREMVRQWIGMRDSGHSNDQMVEAATLERKVRQWAQGDDT
jgi:hypothetical protein